MFVLYLFLTRVSFRSLKIFELNFLISCVYLCCDKMVFVFFFLIGVYIFV